MERDAAAMRKMAGMDLPYDLDQALTPEMEKLAERLERAAKEMREANKGPGIPKAGGLSDKVAKACEGCKGGKKEYEEEVMAPLEHLAKIFPLLQDEARYLSVYQRQKDLAERLESLKGHDGEDNPALKARMRDLQTEQEHLREELRQLLDDIDDHLTQLPEDPRLDDLRETAAKFSRDVRASGAAETMAEAESGLAAFSGTQGHENAQRAAEILEKFISQCGGMGKGGQACLKFQPKLSSSMGATVEQLLADMGMGTGMGMGIGGGGGYSASRNSLANVGLYGGLPTMGDEARFGEGGSALRGMLSDGTGPGGDDSDPMQVDAREMLRATAAGEGVVPARYRNQVGAYFQRIADEMGQR
jgi:hypothetical protein